MDARSLFATLAMAFILWLIRTWIKWDIDEKAASQSRYLLKQRLSDTISRERVAISRATQEFTPAAVADTVTESTEVDEHSECVAKKAHLQQQLTELEAQAKASGQSDLELRRLQGELSSVYVEKSSATLQLEALEARIRNQQSLLDTIDKQPDAKSEGGQSQYDVQETSLQKDPEPAAQDDIQTGEVTSAKKPLYQAPADKDDLKLIKGIGPVMENTLNELGVATFRQLASFDQSDIDKVSDAIGTFSGRIERDDWIGQAQKFVNNESTA